VFRSSILPLTLIFSCIAAVPALWRAANGIQSWPQPTLAAAASVGFFLLLELALWTVLPGAACQGPVTPAGNSVKYRINGLSAWIVTHVVLLVGALTFHWFSLAAIYDRLGSILTVSSILGFGLSIAFYIKGLKSSPEDDARITGNVIFDFFQGIELNPRVLGLDLKHFLITRFGMMSWSVILMACCAKQYELLGRVSNSMLVAVALQTAYIVKFFWWESGYVATLDLMHDRLGFYLGWASVTWIPCIYTLSTQYLVLHPNPLGTAPSVALLVFGLAALLVNYGIDAQRQKVRRTGGRCTVFGKTPDLIRAVYKTSNGQTHENVLLTSGWWGVSRHFNYVAEIATALAWTLPCGFSSPLPYAYVVFLTVLLIDRSLRDDARCREKYGSAWIEYCRRVPYRIVPGVF
jgi:7-dehydrocholesterol reductase